MRDLVRAVVTRQPKCGEMLTVLVPNPTEAAARPPAPTPVLRHDIHAIAGFGLNVETVRKLAIVWQQRRLTKPELD